jgi:CheY-like chemotaxis protein
LIGDVSRLRQILLNVLNNAIKFTEHGSVVLTVEWSPAGGDDAIELHMAVRDTGIGIAPDQIERLFQSFSQTEASISRRFGGTGLGLAISKRLAEAMGGTMWAESQGPGLGSTFHVKIAARVAPPDAVPTGAAPRPGSTDLDPEQAAKHPLRILLAEDNAVNQKVARRLLANIGYEPDIVGDGLRAIEALEKTDYDVVLMDVQMPELDGLEATRRIRARWPDRPLHIIAMTANAMAGDRDACLAAGMNDYVSKPIRPAELASALAQAPSPVTVTRAATGAKAATGPRATRRPKR